MLVCRSIVAFGCARLIRSCVASRSPLLLHRTGVMRSAVLLRRSLLLHCSVLLRRSLVRRSRMRPGLRLLLRLWLSRVGFFGRLLVLCW